MAEGRICVADGSDGEMIVIDDCVVWWEWLFRGMEYRFGVFVSGRELR